MISGTRLLRQKSVLITILFAFTANVLFGASLGLDSLLNIIEKSPEDSSKVNAINRSFMSIMNDDYDLALELSNQAEALAESLGYSMGLSKSLANTATYYWYNGYYDKAVSNYKRAIQLQPEDLQLAATANNHIGLIFYYQAIYDSASFYHQQSLNYFSKMRDSLGIARIAFHMGLLDYYQSKYEDAVDHYLEALEIYSQHDQAMSQARMLNAMSKVYQALGQTEMIWETQQELVMLANRESDSKNSALFNDQIGDIFFLTNSYDSALVYFHKALDQFGKDGEIKNYDFVSEKIAQIYHKQGNHEEAMKYINRSYEIRQRNGTRIHIAGGLTHMGDIYFSAGKQAAAELYYSKSLKMHLDMNNAISMARSYTRLARFYFKTGQYEKSIKNALLGLETSRQISLRQSEIEQLKILSDAYYKQGDLVLAFGFLDEFHDKKEEVTRGKTLQRISRLQVKYNQEKNNRLIAQLKQKEISQAAKLERRDLLVVTSVVAMLLLITISLLLYNRYQLKARNMELLALKHQEAEEDNALLNRKNREGELLLAEIRHRIKNNLQTISSLLNIHSRTLSSKQKDLIQQSHDRVRAMALIHQKLNKQTNYTVIELSSYLRELTQNLIVSYGGNHIKLKVSDEHLPVEADLAVHIGLITNELITNALKHAFIGVAKPQLKIEASRLNSDKICITVVDNGLGFSGEYNKEGSFGIRMISILLEELDGSLEFKDHRGTKAIVHMACVEPGSQEGNEQSKKSLYIS